jgi:serine/threonine-protein kinase HipA
MTSKTQPRRAKGRSSQKKAGNQKLEQTPRSLKPPAEIPETKECFVYIMLPGQTEFVTAGRYELGLRAGVPLGSFVYGKSYLSRDDAVEIDPIELRLAARKYQTTLLKGLFSALRDAGPDHWGRLIIERHNNRELSELGYLLNSADDRAGALSFGIGATPPSPRKKFNQTLMLAELQQIADDLLSDKKPLRKEQAEQIEKLMLINTMMGGARPKALVEDEEGLWIAKFNRPKDDKWDYALVERTMLLLAKECGITVSDSKIETIGDRDALLVRRFDRDKVKKGIYYRNRMISALTLLQAEESDQSKWSYVTLAEQIRRISHQPKRDAHELFRRMCFNTLVSNADDHPRNHAAIATGEGWKLSPAYDLTPKPQIALERRNLAMTCGTAGTYANINNLLSQSQRFLLRKEEAETIILEMEEIVRKSWWRIARSEGVTETDCDLIADAFVYPGFSYALEAA